jgi:putative oxidoreductase
MYGLRNLIMHFQRITKPTVAAYVRLVKSASSVQSLFLLAVRLYWGWQFAQTGWGKLQHIPKVTDFFASLGIPAPGLNAVAVSWMEFLGGIFLAAGLGSRFFGLILAFDMVVAYITADRAALLSIFSDPGKFYADDAYTFLFASILILIFGPGRLSLDALTQRRFGWRIERAPSSVVA